MKTLAIRKLHLTIILGCLTMTSAWGQKASMQFDKMQIAQTDQNYQPIERTSKTKQQSGTIQIFKDEIRIIQSNTSNYQKFTITKYRKLSDRYEFAATNSDGNWAFSLWKQNGQNIFMALWIDQQIISVFNISSGFTLDIPFLK
jgi:hypothetical protein